MTNNFQTLNSEFPQQYCLSRLIFLRVMQNNQSGFLHTYKFQHCSASSRPNSVLLWVRCPFGRLSISDSGGKWSLKWKFRKCLSGFIDGTPNYISRPNLVKIGRCEVAERSSGLPQKKLWRRGTRPSPIFPKMGRLLPKFPEVVNPWPVYVPNLVRIGSVLPDLFRKDWFSAQKVNKQQRDEI